MRCNFQQKNNTQETHPSFIRSGEPKNPQCITNSTNKMIIVKSAISNQLRYQNNYLKSIQIKFISLAKWRSKTIGKRNSLRNPKMLTCQKYDTLLPELQIHQTTTCDKQNSQANHQRLSSSKLTASVERKIKSDLRKNKKVSISKKSLTESTEKPEMAKDINFEDIFSIKKIDKLLKAPRKLFQKHRTIQIDNKVSTRYDCDNSRTIQIDDKVSRSACEKTKNKKQEIEGGKKIFIKKIARNIQRQKTMNILELNNSRQSLNFFRQTNNFGFTKDWKDLSGWQTTSITDF